MRNRWPERLPPSFTDHSAVQPLTAKQYELYVAELVRSLNFGKKGTVSVNRRYDGKRQPGSYEVDVSLEVQLATALKFWLIVECKNWKRPVDRPVVQKIAQTRDAIGADKAAIASPIGFSQEAEEVAKTLEVALWVITVREWITVHSGPGIEHFSLELLKKDIARDWEQSPAFVDVVPWSRELFQLHTIRSTGQLPRHLRWVRFVASPYASSGRKELAGWAHDKLLRFDDALWEARVRGTEFHEPD